MNRREFIVTGLAGGAAALTVGLPFAQAGQAQYPADYGTIIEASKAEGSLLAYSTMTEKEWVNVIARYNQLYPWIKVETLDLDGQVLIERYLAEKGTGSQTADFMMSSSVEGWLDLIDRGEIMDYRSPELTELPDWSLPSPGLYSMNIEPVVLIWNKALLPENLVPTGLADLAEKVKSNPDVFRGKITTYSAEKHTVGYLTHRALVNRFGEKAWEWFEAIGPMTIAVDSGGPIIERVISGESVFAYFSASAPTWNAIRDPAIASLMGWSFIADAQPLMLKGAAIPAAAKNVNAAKLWLDVILSREGQIALALGGRTPLRPDVSMKDTDGNYTYSEILEAVGEPNTIMIGFDRDEGRAEFLKRWKENFDPA